MLQFDPYRFESLEASCLAERRANSCDVIDVFA